MVVALCATLRYPLHTNYQCMLLVDPHSIQSLHHHGSPLIDQYLLLHCNRQQQSLRDCRIPLSVALYLSDKRNPPTDLEFPPV